MISVANQGPDIDALEQGMIFDKFLQREGSEGGGAKDGDGIANCTAIVERTAARLA